jgi:hypothetical protein
MITRSATRRTPAATTTLFVWYSIARLNQLESS